MRHGGSLNFFKDRKRYPHVTLAFDDWKRFSAHKGQRNPTTMTYSLDVRYFRQQGNISYTQNWNTLICEILNVKLAKIHNKLM